MPSFSFVTTGRDWQSDVDQIGHSTFTAEAAELVDVAKVKQALSALFTALEPDWDFHCAVSLQVDDANISAAIQTTDVPVPVEPATPPPEMSDMELTRNLGQQEERRQAVEALVAEARANGVIE